METLKSKDEINQQLLEYGIQLGKLTGYELCQYNLDDTLLKQGEEIKHIFIVLSGNVKVCVLAENGKDMILSHYLSKGIMGDIEFLQEDKSASATSIAFSAVNCLKIPLPANFEYLTNNIIFMNHLAKGLSSKLLKSNNSHMSSALFSGKERLCAYILISEKNDFFSDIKMEVSKSIGISYRQLFRILNELCKCGALEKRESGYKILDRAYLQKNAIGK